jgi:hypothetical protein
MRGILSIFFERFGNWQAVQLGSPMRAKAKVSQCGAAPGAAPVCSGSFSSFCLDDGGSKSMLEPFSLDFLNI